MIFNRYKLLILLKLGAFLIFPIFLFFIPVSFLDNLPELCLFKNITGHQCFGCGMTHAFISVLNGKFIDAFNYNKLVVIVFPLLVVIYFTLLIKTFKKLFNN